MPKNARTGIASQIIGSFEDIGEKVVSEVAKVPADIAGKALESLGASSGKKPQAKPTGDDVKKPERSPLDVLSQEKNTKIKEQIDRQALARLAGDTSVPREPSVRERLESEIDQKNKLAKEKAAKAAWAKLPYTGKKRKGPGLAGSAKQKSGAETSRNVRGD